MSEERTMGAIATAVVAVVALVLASGSLIVSAGRPGAAPAATPAAAAAPDAATAVSVSLSEFSISPDAIEIAQGGTITVTNAGVAEHDFAVVGTDVATPMLRGGESHELQLGDLAPGTYEVHCTVPGHDTGGMTGTLVVVGAGDEPVPAVAAGDEGGHGMHGADKDWAAYDAAMHDSILAFPAETEGLGNQPLEPEILPDGTKRFELVAEIVDWEVEPGKFVEAWTYNGTVPGPMIQTEIGDKVQIEVTNNLPMGTDVHWHGIQVPNAQDGVAPLTQELIAPGDSLTYEFVTEESAVNMYHPHHHAQMKVPNGMWGVFLVGELPMPEAGSVIGGQQLPDDMTIDQVVPMVVNDAGTIGMSLNGKSFPATAPIVATEGDNILIHYYNEGFQIHPMHLHGMPQLVVAKDGFPLDQPYWADTVNVAPGERYSVVVHADMVGAWAFHCHILTHAESDEGMFGMVTALIVEAA